MVLYHWYHITSVIRKPVLTSQLEWTMKSLLNKTKIKVLIEDH